MSFVAVPAILDVPVLRLDVVEGDVKLRLASSIASDIFAVLLRELDCILNDKDGGSIRERRSERRWYSEWFYGASPGDTDENVCGV